MSDVQKINRIPVISRVLDALSNTTGMGFTAVVKVTEDQWITCATKDLISFGLKPGDELKVETTLCNLVRQQKESIVVDNIAEHPVYSKHPGPASYGFQSYIGVPIIRRNGEFFGSLCAMDPLPAKVDSVEVLDAFNLFADLISFHLDAVEQQDECSGVHSREQEEQDNSQLQEEFIGVLGHDLKNPLATARMSAEILLKVSDKDIITRHASMVKATTYRLESMIENLLDFKRSRIGNDIQLRKEAEIEALEKALQQAIREIGIISPDRFIETDIRLETPFYCDPGKIGQLFLNLLSNANSNGTTKHPIQVKIRSNDEGFLISVAHKGEEIPIEQQENIFNPYYQTAEGSFRKGLGLGLFVASEIAKAHGGKIELTSTEEETRFTFRCN